MFLGKAFAEAGDLPLDKAQRYSGRVRMAQVSYIPESKRALMDARAGKPIIIKRTTEAEDLAQAERNLLGLTRDAGRGEKIEGLKGVSIGPASGSTTGAPMTSSASARSTRSIAANVVHLGLAWFAEFDTDRGQEATPLMVDGTLYTTTAWSKVFAFDARTGKQLSGRSIPRFPAKRASSACCDVVNRGVAVWGGKRLSSARSTAG
jgi:outer membrane protein assembly factor BamB